MISFTDLAREKRRAEVMALVNRMSLREQLSVLCDLIQNNGGSDDYIDAMIPVDAAFTAAWGQLEHAADEDAFGNREGPSFGLHHPDSPSFGSVRA